MFKELEELKQDMEYHNKKWGYVPLLFIKQLEAMEIGWKRAEEKYEVYKLKHILLKNTADSEQECNCKTCLIAREEIKELVKK